MQCQVNIWKVELVGWPCGHKASALLEQKCTQMKVKEKDAFPTYVYKEGTKGGCFQSGHDPLSALVIKLMHWNKWNLTICPQRGLAQARRE